jgi:hypothetical protein
MCKRLALVSLLMLSGLALALAQGVQAQSRWPERPVRIVVPYAAGGNTDGIARITAQAMQESLGQPFVVENRVGGNGSVAAEFTARAEPDGHTLFMAVQGIFAIVPAMSKVRYDPIADFTPISIIGSNQFALSVGKAVPVNSFKEWLDWARAQPTGKLNYSSGSIGSGSHLTMALLLARAGIKAEHVPYKGGALSLQALVSGQVPMGFNNVSEAWAWMWWAIPRKNLPPSFAAIFRAGPRRCACLAPRWNKPSRNFSFQSQPRAICNEQRKTCPDFRWRPCWRGDRFGAGPCRHTRHRVRSSAQASRGSSRCHLAAFNAGSVRQARSDR